LALSLPVAITASTGDEPSQNPTGTSGSSSRSIPTTYSVSTRSLAEGFTRQRWPAAKTHNKSKKPTSGIFPAMTTSTRRGTATGTG